MVYYILLGLIMLVAFLVIAKRKTKVIQPTIQKPPEPGEIEEEEEDLPDTDEPSLEIQNVVVVNQESMANFSTAYALVARQEGGYQKLANDPGNWNSQGQLVGTNWGISARVYESVLGRVVTEADMRNMSAEEAKRIYKIVFWDRNRIGEIIDQQVANIYFDGVVNHGRGVRLMQEVLEIRADNVSGPQTIREINSRNPRVLFNGYKERRRQYYEQLLRNSPSLEVPWRRVWMNRINSFQYQDLIQGTGEGGALALLAIGVATFFLYR